MENTRAKTYYVYLLEHHAAPEALPETKEFGFEDYCIAREAYLQRHEQDTYTSRSGHFTTGLYPNTQLFLLHLDADRQEVKRRRILSNRHQPYPFGRMEPLAKSLLTARNAGKQWFAEDEDQQREFFDTESEALAFSKKAYSSEDTSHRLEKWQLYNLDRHLDMLEGRSIQYFLLQRSALSTNQLEVLADLGRGTLSKIKNGQRILSRKQYGRIVRVLQHYGYVAWVDLRQVQSEK
jgi:hypothetical protein